MADTYYIDMSAAYVHNANSGKSQGECWNGPGGFQRAIENASAGDTILLRNGSTPANNIPVSRLWMVDSTVSSVGDVLENLDTGATGIVVAVYDLYGLVMVEDDGTMDWNNGDEYTVNGSGSYTFSLFPYTCGIQLDAMGGSMEDGDTTDGRITVQGVASDWSTDELAYLNGNSLVDYIFTTGDDFGDYWCFKNLLMINASSCGFQFANAVADSKGWVLENVHIKNSGYYAVNMGSRLTQSLFINVWIEDSTTEGFHFVPTSSLFVGCVFTGNGSYAAYKPSNSMFVNCLFHNNSGPAISNGINTFWAVMNSVLDGNAINVHSTSAPVLAFMMFNRNTNASETGVSCSAAYPTFYADYNAYYNTSQFSNFTPGDNSHGSGTNNDDMTEDGYMDKANDDFSLKPVAIGREVVWDLPDSINQMVTAMGLLPAEIRARVFDSPFIK